MIPQKIHYIWLGRGEKSDKIKKCLASWHKHLSKFDIKEWNEEDLDYEAELKRYPFLKKLHKSKGWEYLSDYFRVKVLYEQGGIYLDTDMEVLKDLSPLLKNKFFVGMETDDNKANIEVIGKVILGTAIIGAIKNHPLLKANLNYYREKFPKPSDRYTNTVILTQLFKEHYRTNTIEKDYPDAKIYDKSYFYPFYHIEVFDTNKVLPHTYTIHWWTVGWLKNSDLMYYLSTKGLTGRKKLFSYIESKIIRKLLSKMKRIEEKLLEIKVIKILYGITPLLKFYRATKNLAKTLAKISGKRAS